MTQRAIEVPRTQCANHERKNLSLAIVIAPAFREPAQSKSAQRQKTDLTKARKAASKEGNSSKDD